VSTVERMVDYLKTADLSPGNQPAAAKALGMAPRTLVSHLSEHGTTYSALVMKERRRRFEALMGRNPHADTYAAMKVTGYKAGNSVTIAAKRWFGTTFREYRRA